MNGQIGPAGSLRLIARPWRLLSADNDRYAVHANHRARKALPHWVFLMTLTAILAMGWSLHEASTEAHESSAGVHDTHEILKGSSAVEEQLSRAESAVRGYVVS